MKLPATVLGAIEQPLLRRMTAIEDRVRKLEDPERGPGSRPRQFRVRPRFP